MDVESRFVPRVFTNYWDSTMGRLSVNSLNGEEKIGHLAVISIFDGKIPKGFFVQLEKIPRWKFDIPAFKNSIVPRTKNFIPL